MKASRQHQAFINGLWKDIHITEVGEFTDIRLAEPPRPQMPKPLGNFADHSCPLYTKAQMLEAMHAGYMLGENK